MLKVNCYNAKSRERGVIFCAQLLYWLSNTFLCDHVETIEGSVDVIDYVYHPDDSIGICIKSDNIQCVNSN